VRQRNEVHYGEVHFVKCIMSKPTVAMGKIAINSLPCVRPPAHPIVSFSPHWTLAAGVMDSPTKLTGDEVDSQKDRSVDGDSSWSSGAITPVVSTHLRVALTAMAQLPPEVPTLASELRSHH
jgi:hypothetical protein